MTRQFNIMKYNRKETNTTKHTILNAGYKLNYRTELVRHTRLQCSIYKKASTALTGAQRLSTIKRNYYVHKTVNYLTCTMTVRSARGRSSWRYNGLAYHSANTHICTHVLPQLEPTSTSAQHHLIYARHPDQGHRMFFNLWTIYTPLLVQ